MNWDTKTALISLQFREDSFSRQILATSARDLSSFLKQRTLTFPPKGSALRLLLGRSESPGSPLLRLGAITEENEGDLHTSTAVLRRLSWSPRRPPRDRRAGGAYSMQMPDKGMIHVLGRTEQDSSRFPCAAQNGTRFKTYELFTSGIFHLIYSSCGVPDQGKGNPK